MKQKFLKIRISDELYKSFQDACSLKNRTMSSVLRNFARYYSQSDNVVLMNLDDEILKKTIILCQEKNIKFEELIAALLKTAINSIITDTSNK